MITKTKGKQQKQIHKILPKSVLPRHVLPICPVVTFQSSIWAKGQKAGSHFNPQPHPTPTINCHALPRVAMPPPSILRRIIKRNYYFGENLLVFLGVHFFGGVQKSLVVSDASTSVFRPPIFAHFFFCAEKSIFSKIMKIITFEAKFRKFVRNLI